MSKKLNQRHLLFIDAVLRGSSFTQAARDAGYSQRSAASAGCRLAKDPRIKDEITRLRGQAETDAIMDHAEASELLSKIARDDTKSDTIRIKALSQLSSMRGWEDQRIEKNSDHHLTVEIVDGKRQKDDE